MKKNVCTTKFLIQCLRMHGFKANYNNVFCGFFLNGSTNFFYFFDNKKSDTYKCTFSHYPKLRVTDLEVRKCFNG